MSSSELGNNTKKSVIWFTVLPFAMHLLRFANSILLARLLMPEDFGVISIVTILLFYSNSFTDFGLSNAVVQRKEVNKEHYGTLFIFNFLISLVLFGLFNEFASDIAKYYNTPILADALQVFSYVFLISAFITGPNANLRRRVKFKTLAIIEVVKVASSISVSLTFALNGYGLWSIIFAMLVAQTVAMLLTMYFSEIRIVLSCSKNAFKQLYNFSLWSFFNLQVTLLSENIDKLILGKILNVSALGIFDKGVGLAKMPYEQLSARIANVSFSTFSRVQDDQEQLRYYFSKLLIVNCLICFPIFIGLASVAEDFTLVLLGENWAGMIPVLELISVAYLINSLIALTSSFNLATGNIRKQVVFRFFLTIAMITALLFYAESGLTTVSYILVGFYSCLLIVSLYLVNKIIEMRLSRVITLLFAPMISTLVMIFTIGLIQFVMSEMSGGIRLFICILGGAISYSLCVLILPFKEWKFVRNSVYNQFKKRFIRNKNLEIKQENNE